jgi:hypothetical protein
MNVFKFISKTLILRNPNFVPRFVNYWQKENHKPHFVETNKRDSCEQKWMTRPSLTSVHERSSIITVGASIGFATIGVELGVGGGSCASIDVGIGALSTKGFRLMGVKVFTISGESGTLVLDGGCAMGGGWGRSGTNWFLEFRQRYARY